NTIASTVQVSPTTALTGNRPWSTYGRTPSITICSYGRADRFRRTLALVFIIKHEHVPLARGRRQRVELSCRENYINYFTNARLRLPISLSFSVTIIVTTYSPAGYDLTGISMSTKRRTASGVGTSGTSAESTTESSVARVMIAFALRPSNFCV